VLGGGTHVPRWAGNRIEALFKPLGVTEGISDIPWHKDCSLGRHSYECCSLTIGISVTGAGPTSGQLRVVPGSHRALVWPSLFDASQLDLPDLALPTETGDVTAHLSCTLHRAQPPTDQERRVPYTGFSLPPRDPDAAAAGRRRLQASRESAPLTTSQAPVA
jgi:ectoine hydroxylase-related dioxygenase (phytanoyl-CoA dioxygenase family)